MSSLLLFIRNVQYPISCTSDSSRSDPIPIPGRPIPFDEISEVPDYIRFDGNDYLYECISILNHCEKFNDDEVKDFELILEDKKDRHSILFSLLALIIVERSMEDVATVTVYQCKDDLTVYYNKNDLSNKDNEHVDNVNRLVRNTAHDKQITCLIFN